MLKIDREKEQRVREKRDLFISKIRGKGLTKEVITEIEEIAYSMEKANLLGEKELALQYKRKIKNLIVRN